MGYKAIINRVIEDDNNSYGDYKRTISESMSSSEDEQPDHAASWDNERTALTVNTNNAEESKKERQKRLVRRKSELPQDLGTQRALEQYSQNRHDASGLQSNAEVEEERKKTKRKTGKDTL